MTGIIAQNVGRTSGLIKAASGGGGVWTLIKTLTASADATLSFVDGTDDVVLDSTYPIYVIKFINVHPATNNANFQFNGSVDTGSNYNVTKTSTFFYAYEEEADGANILEYRTDYDLAQGTGFQSIAPEIGSENDECASGSLHLFSPSDTTFVKHYISTANGYQGGNYSINHYCAGYINTTSAVDAIQFKMSSGNIDAGTIKLYGLKDSA